MSTAMNRLAPRLAALALLVILAAPAAAQATDFCVAPNMACGGTNVATLQTALATADDAADADRVFLGEAT
jgi:hypothetical protein